MNKKIEALLVALLVLITIYIWTSPFQKNQMPFGDVDSSTHFALGDYSGQKGTTSTQIPPYLKYRYGG